MGERIKGQEVRVVLVVNRRPVTTVSACRSLDFGFDQEIKSEGYLGETSERKDTIFKGIDGKLEFHLEGRELLDIAAYTVEISRRRVASAKVNLQFALRFPGARPVQVIAPNVVFGKWPFQIGGRAEYVSVSVDWACTEIVLA